jgi:hypothetical protein
MRYKYLTFYFKKNQLFILFFSFLTVYNVSVFDEGVYTCFARNLTQPGAVGSVDKSRSDRSKETRKRITPASKKRKSRSIIDTSVAGLGSINSFEFVELFSIHLLMAMQPAVEHKLETWNLVEGSPLLLSVSVNGAPTPHCHWKFNGQSLEAGAGHFFGAVVSMKDTCGGRSSVLEVLAVTEDHSGTYTCVCENAVGSARWEEALVTVRPRTSG